MKYFKIGQKIQETEYLYPIPNKKVIRKASTYSTCKKKF